VGVLVVTILPRSFLGKKLIRWVIKRFWLRFNPGEKYQVKGGVAAEISSQKYPLEKRSQ